MKLDSESPSSGGTHPSVDHGALFEHAPCAMLVVDPNEQITAANGVAVTLLSAGRSRLVGRSFTGLVSPQDRARVRSIFREHGAPRELQVQMQVRHRRSEVVIMVGSNADEESRVIESLVVLRSATPLETTSDERRQASKMEALGRLAGGIAHDFNTALTGIVGCADVALRRIDEGQSGRDYVVEIREAAMRASAMPRKLVDFSRRRVTALSVFDVGQVLEKIEPALRRVAGDRVELLFALTVESARIRCDEGQIAQMVTNLVANARDAIDGDGLVVVQTQRTDIRRTSPGRLRYLPPGPYVCISVRDSGRGMDEATLARIFEPFFSTKDEEHGTGLGLTMVASTVEAAHGHIETTSEPMQGTTVRVYLPEAEAPEVATASPAILGGNETILVLEDDALVRKTIRDSLENRGYRVLEADCGTEAIRKCRTYGGPIHLVLADLALPGITGWDTVRVIHSERPEIQVVFMSASYPAEEISAQAALEPGRNFIEKPFAEGDLAALLRQRFQAALS